MRHEDYKELLALEAAGALDAGERRALEEHLPSCAECRAELRELCDAAAALAFTVAPVAPPAHLRSRVLEQVRGLAPSTRRDAAHATAGAAATSELARETNATDAGTRRPAVGAEEARGLLARMSLWQLLRARPSLAFGAAAVVVAFALLGTTTLLLRSRAQTLQVELTRVSQRLRESQTALAGEREQLARTRDVNDLLASPGTSMAQLAGKDVAPRARAFIAYDRSTGRAAMLASGLPPAPAGHAYQLWLIADNKPLPGGTFKSDADGRARMNDRLPSGISKPTFAVTLEREGGESAPKGEMYLLGSAS
ncbi:MAG TPA: anti-sigma factor [Pyrinomonadaceae bacterium]|jgi:anti-sigma-K factor RskA|nr:anti-sigma factor [Pyrinomonadaceae bacterium]